MTNIQYLLIGVSAIAAGAVNAVAGGGTLITFPLLISMGIPAVVANITNTVALCPGYLAATFAQRNDLRGQQRRLWLYLLTGVVGGVAGGFLLLHTGERLFSKLVPYLILFAAGLLAVQDTIRTWLLSSSQNPHSNRRLESFGVMPVFLASVYGGYFGAGVSVVVLAVLGLVLDDSLIRLNALKQGIAFAINIAAAIFFIFSGMVNWDIAIIMAVGALLGGVLGGKTVGRIRPIVLRRIVVVIGVLVASAYWIR